MGVNAARGAKNKSGDVRLKKATFLTCINCIGQIRNTALEEEEAELTHTVWGMYISDFVSCFTCILFAF